MDICDYSKLRNFLVIEETESETSMKLLFLREKEKEPSLVDCYQQLK